MGKQQYIKSPPTYGDEKYKSSYNKEIIDIIRIRHYEKLGKEPRINDEYIGNISGYEEYQIRGTTLKVRGLILFFVKLNYI